MTVASAWQERCARVRQRAACLLSLGAWSDCCFVAGARRERVAAHRLLLAMASPVFEVMFFGPLAERGDSIDIPDIETGTFKALLKYIYTDNVEISSCEAAYALYYAADKYMLPRLKSKSIAYLFRKLSPQNVGRTYEFGELIGENKLKEKCLEMIRTNTMKLLRHRSFGELQLHTLVKIFSLEPLNITSELDLFEATKDYVLAQSKKVVMEEYKVKPIEAANNCIVNDETDSADEKDENTRVSIRNAIEKIRFLTLDHQQFAKYDFSALLTQSEVFAIAMNLMARHTFREMPSGFSTSRKPRYKLTEMEDGRTQGTFRTVVNDLENLTEYWCTKVNVCNVFWELRVATTNNTGHKYLSVYLRCNSGDPSKSSCDAEAEVRLLSNRIDTEPVCMQLSHSKNGLGWRWPRFMKWVDLTDPELGYVKHNSITLEARVKVRE